MKRTTLFLPEDLERDLLTCARRERKPMAAVVREALAEYVAARGTAGRLPSFTAVGSSGRSDMAERHEELLFRDPVHPGPPTQALRRSSGRKTVRPARTTHRRR